jgi:prepilin-type N-terminal cleavage/methylation domain-containing protein
MTNAIRAFSLIEVVIVIAILATLMTAGVSLLSGTGSHSRRVGVDQLAGIIEQARTHAITSRSHVLLAIAEPADLPAGDDRCRIGLFQIDDWPSAHTTSAVDGVLLSRWQPLNRGVVLVGGDLEGIANPMDLPQIAVTYVGGKQSHQVVVHAIAFNPRGGLHFPSGSSPVVFRLAEGAYRNGKASPNKPAGQAASCEELLKVGRVIARPYRIEG